MVHMLWEQGRTEVKVVRCRLMLEAFLPLRAFVISSLGLLPRAISGSHESTTARVCCQQMAHGCQVSGVPLVAIWVSKIHSATGVMLI